MNQTNRIKLEQIKNKLISHLDEINVLKEDIEGIRDEEQEKFDNLPEGFQQAETGQKIEECANHLDSASTNFDDIETAVNSVIDDIDNAINE